MISRKRAAGSVGGGARFRRPAPREAAMLILCLLEAKQEEVQQEITRARLSEITVRRLWIRSRVSNEFLVDVQEELIRRGWVLFWAGSTYAIIKAEAVEGWGQISSKRIADKLKLIEQGRFGFETLEYLLLPADESNEQTDDL
jgi:hypothetical protein